MREREGERESGCMCVFMIAKELFTSEGSNVNMEYVQKCYPQNTLYSVKDTPCIECIMKQKVGSFKFYWLIRLQIY